MSGSDERLTAARLLIRVEAGAFASRLLAEGGGAGVRTRVLGVLRWMRALDAALGTVCSRPLPRLDAEVRAVLRIGLLESAEMGVPAPVSTDAAVRTIRRLGKASAAGMVNAILRRAPAAWRRVMEDADPALRTSHPAWLAERWFRELGPDAAAEVMAVDQTPAPMWVWFREQGSIHELGEGLVRHPWCPDAWTAPERAAGLARAVGRGEAHAQDPASQLVSRLASKLAGGGPVVDLCAAPGGKAALLRRLGYDGRLALLDLRLSRVRLVSRMLDRLDALGIGDRGGAGVNPAPTIPEPVVLAVGDATHPAVAPAAWSLVVLDAPCSGTGTLRRHPELRWRLSPERISELADLQRRMLDAALDLVASGGALLYSTCSIEPEENEALVRRLPSALERIDLEPLLPAGTPARATPAGGIRLLPRPECDGFTIHALQWPE